MLMEKINGVNLRQLIERKTSSSMSNYQKYHICGQLINVFKFLHDCKPAVIYRDLKPENIMIDKFFNVKLTDFGLSRFMPETEPYKMTGTTGTLRYMAPEVFNGQHYALKADIYSLGLIIFFVFTGTKPFEKYNLDELKIYFSNDDLIFSTHQVKDKKLRSIINNCIKKSHVNRWDINQLSSSFAELSGNRNPSNCSIA